MCLPWEQFDGEFITSLEFEFHFYPLNLLRFIKGARSNYFPNSIGNGGILE